MTLVKFLQVPHTCGRLEQLRANKYILIELLRVSNIGTPRQDFRAILPMGFKNVGSKLYFRGM
jgi:hypothetical protein